MFLCNVKKTSHQPAEISYFHVEGHPVLLETATSTEGMRPVSVLKSKLKIYMVITAAPLSKGIHICALLRLKSVPQMIMKYYRYSKFRFH